MMQIAATARPVALVTGAGGDIGRAIALRLARSSEAVAIVDIDQLAARETADLVIAAGCRTIAISADVSSDTETAAFVDTVEHELGPIGIFANNAGIEGIVAPLHDYPVDTFDRVYQVNMRGVFLGMKHVLARMRRRGEGAIVNTASTSAIRGRAGLAGYVASKHAVLGLTRTAALEVTGTRIRVNAILPGPVESRMIRELDEQARRDSLSPRRVGAAPYGRCENIADVVAFLASDAAAHVNGAALVVDAGMSVA
jgi:NAD(P)-dependent dehydrogenase (short-subunit alcohol dehydrogenase family)